LFKKSSAGSREESIEEGINFFEVKTQDNPDRNPAADKFLGRVFLLPNDP